MLQERQQLAAQFSENAVGKSLREASGGDLATVAATVLGTPNQSGPTARPVLEAAVLAVQPPALSLEDLGAAALAGSAGSSLFWGGNPAAVQSPFWRVQATGASKGTADD